jgi:hypothetical protein
MVHPLAGVPEVREWKMGTPVQTGEPEVVALAKIAGRERADLPPDGIPVSRAFPRQIAV